MIEKNLKIINKLGLHARPASKLVRLASQYESDVRISYMNNTINAKSIMGLMMLAVEQGAVINIRVEGEDEEELMKSIEELVADGFGEDEEMSGR